LLKFLPISIESRMKRISKERGGKDFERKRG